MPDVRDRLRGPADTRLLWDVCQIPDFRKVTPAEHASLCVRLFRFLHDGGKGGGGIPTDWLARQIGRIDRTDGDIDALSKRLAYIRTWTYVAQRPGLDRRRGALARRDPCGRRPAVGCAARAADPAVRRPADVGPDASAEAEGEPGGDCDRKWRGLDRRPVHRPSRGIPVPARPAGGRRPGAHAARRRARGAGAGALAPVRQVLQRPGHRDRRHRAGRADVGRARRRPPRGRCRRAFPPGAALRRRGRRPGGRREGEAPPRPLDRPADRPAFRPADRAPRRREPDRHGPGHRLPAGRDLGDPAARRGRRRR